VAKKRSFSGRKSPQQRGFKSFQTWLTPAEKFRVEVLLFHKKLTIKEWVLHNTSKELNELADKNNSTVMELIEEYKKHKENKSKKSNSSDYDINIKNL
jgi:Na+/phosphate symporter